jgi:hypothetical protein
MYAQRVAQALGMRQFAHTLEVGSLHRRNHHLRDTCLTSTLQHSAAVRIEFGGVKMDVGVYPHAGIIGGVA